MKPLQGRHSYQALMLVGTLTLGSAARAGADDAPAPVTYAERVAPIFNQNCVSCHRPGQIGPMSLMSFDEVRPWAKAIKKSIAEHKMPPWHANAPAGTFKDERRMSDEDSAAVMQWVDQGAQLGDASKLPPAPVFSTEWQLGAPDQIFTMQKPYHIADDLEDQYETFVIPTGLTEDKWVIGTELRPGAYDSVHHILVFVIKAGVMSEEKIQALLSDEGTEKGENGIEREAFSGGLFAKYAPGANAELWPADYGRKLPAGCLLAFQIHYHKTPGPGTGGKDQSSLAVKYAPGEVKNPLTTAWLIHPMFEIPPNNPNVEAASVFKFIDDGQIHALAPHLHLRGKSFSFEAKYPDGHKVMLLDVPHYDFNWQTSYIFKEPLQIPKGTEIRAVGTWDNSAANPNNPDPNQTIRWGSASTDEMMIGFMDYTYNTKKKFQSMYGAPEGVNMSPLGGGLGGDGETRRKLRERFQERRRERGGAQGQVGARVRERLQELKKLKEEREGAKPTEGAAAAGASTSGQ